MEKPTYKEFYDAVVEDYRPSNMLTGEAFDKAIKENEDVILGDYKDFCKSIDSGRAEEMGWELKDRVSATSYNLYMLI
ncbi:Uncharacterised protein [Urinicoccus massiliensis]|uniref:Uncharacterized protein n=1 Tax=Urinicoccus massiliensis TaxID=1723382 RepID=A0A8H2M7H6_9FIRM|nr:hypothetical protein [Urinicoccus massiliensis]VFB16552.1 Uncharacterised protein [Urinicoccus massiliensis]